MQIKTITWTGDGNDNRGIVGVGFQPDLVIVLSDLTENAYMWHKDKGGDASYSMASATAAEANIIQAVGADGFTIGDDDAVNKNGEDYYSLCLRDDGEADIHFGSYVGDGNDNRNITDVGMGFTPNFVLIRGDGAFWHLWSVVNADVAMLFANIADAVDHIQGFIPNGFQVGTGASANTNGVTYYYVTLKEVANYFDVGSYVGDGNDNRSIGGVGFQPNEVWIKGTGAQYAMEKSDHLAGDAANLFDDAAAAAPDHIQALEADGFQIGTGASVNTNGVTFRWACFREGTTASGLTVQEPVHDHIVDIVSLVKTYGLTVQDAVHGQVADVLQLVRTRQLAIQDAIHDQIADILQLVRTRQLAVQDAVHSHIADVVSLVKTWGLTVQEPIHDHVADTVSLTKTYGLNVQEPVHDHIVDVISLGRALQLSVVDSIHRHIVDVLTLTRAGGPRYPLRQFTAGD